MQIQGLLRCFFFFYYLHRSSLKREGGRVGEQQQKAELCTERLKECRGQNWQARIKDESYRDGENIEKG